VRRQLLAAALDATLAAGCSALGVGELQAGTLDCVGLASRFCEALLTDPTLDLAEAAAVRIRCKTMSCTETSGSIDIEILWPDGRTEARATFWDGAPLDPRVLAPAVVPPVPPTCQRVLETECDGEWRTAMENLSKEQVADVVLVLVNCSGTCTDTSGSGSTIVGFEDGSRIVASTWSYNHTP
jgi:hypothetical protein